MRALVATKLPRLLALAQRMLGDRAEAEDVAQETFVRIWKQAGRWQTGRAKFDTWAHRVALNLCYDRLRKRRDVITDEVPDQVDPGPLPDAGLAEDSDSRRVEQALQRLAPRQREAIILVYYQDLSNREAASVMSISVDALESLLSRGRRMLQSLLLGDGNDE